MICLKVLRLWPEAERREMSTKKFSSIRHDYNPTMDKLLQDHEHGKLTGRLSNFMTRPAYAHTSMEQRQIFERPMRNWLETNEPEEAADEPEEKQSSGDDNI